MMLFFNGMFSLCRHGKRQKKGRGKRSKARIGPKWKCHDATKKTDVSIPVNPSHWTNVVVPEGWINVSNETEMRLCQISRQDLPNTPLIVVTRSLVVKSDCSWMLHVHGHRVDASHIPKFDEMPFLDPTSTNTLLQKVDSLNTCVGNHDSKIINLANQKKNGQFLSQKQDVVAYLDVGTCVSTEGQEYASTVCTSSCSLLTNGIRCENCTGYRKTLLTLCLRSDGSGHSVHKNKKNYRYLFKKLYNYH